MSELEENIDFDELIRSKYKDHSMSTSNDLWESINTNLNQQKLIQNQKKIRLLQGTTITASVLLVAMFFYFNVKINELEKQNNSSSNIEITSIKVKSDSELVDKQSINPNDISESNNRRAKKYVSVSNEISRSKRIIDDNQDTKKTLYVGKNKKIYSKPNKENQEKTPFSNKNETISQSRIYSKNNNEKEQDHIHQEGYSLNNSDEFLYAQNAEPTTRNNQDNIIDNSTQSYTELTNEEQSGYSTNLNSNIKNKEEMPDSKICNKKNDEGVVVISPTDTTNMELVSVNAGNDSSSDIIEEEQVMQVKDFVTNAEIKEEHDSKTSDLSSLVTKMKNTQLFIEAFYAPGITNRLIRFDKTQSIDAIDKNYLAKTETYAYANTAGICINGQISPKVRLKTGIIYSEYNVNINPTDTSELIHSGDNYYAYTSMGTLPISVTFKTTDYFEYDTIEVVIDNQNTGFENEDEENSNYDNNDDEDDDEEYGNNNTEDNVEERIIAHKTTVTRTSIKPTKVTFTYISIPLEFQYQLAKRFSVNLGVKAEIQIKNNINTIVSSSEFEYSASKAINKVAFAISLGAEYEQPLGKSVALFFTPTVSSFVTPVSNTYPVKTYLNSINIRTGLRLKL